MSDVASIGLRGAVERLRDASNAHDIAAIAACFTDDYSNVTPCHPSRSFVGADQVGRNWTRILRAVPDLVTEVTAVVTDASRRQVWSEWEHRGTRPDGSPHLMRGVIIFTVDEGGISAARFYLEPVDDDGAGVDAAVERQVMGRP
jgi:ketosteroid isomerase-like protein